MLVFFLFNLGLVFLFFVVVFEERFEERFEEENEVFFVGVWFWFLYG